ncbi:hypothetical protein [Streptomyces beijiangensis]|uniref:Uncharacterized protein n=1 Tax=Streptomyces beijiangensis TaxID=163361 RepID=A0A939F7R7_9ACTN|nr:hypothetical protein [Streptomyces beijiangensis]MBO0513371.1 hypothetical protein [Streptomyces beijiangensis]
MQIPRSAFVAAPVLMGAYGIIRILDGLDGSHGPGLAWTTGHLCFLGALAFFVRGFAEMRAIAGRGRLAAVGFWAGTAGVVAVGGQFVIDIVVGFMSADRGAMEDLFTKIQGVPGIEPAFYSFGPMLFFVGQLILVVQLATRRTLKPWAPVLVLIDTTLPFADKDLIPLGAVLLLISFAPLYRRAAPQAALSPRLYAAVQAAPCDGDGA